MQTIGYGSSNYGNSLADFEDGWDATSPTRRRSSSWATRAATGPIRAPTSWGGCRSGRKRIIWLNPEYRSAWGTGDSDMFRYAPFCNVVTVCNTLRHLERVITDLLEDAA